MADVDIWDLCYRDGAHGGVVHAEKRSEDSFRVSNIAEVLVVVHFGPREHYEYTLETDAKQVDAYAKEWWEWQQRYLYYRVNRGGDVVDSGVGTLRRVFQDRLCHWTNRDEEPPSNRRYPELSLWSDKPGAATQNWEGVSFDDGDHVLLDDLNADETERTDSYGDSGVECFELLSDGARAAVEAAGCDPDDSSSLWDEYGYWSGGATHYGQEPVNGVSGFGIAFKDGSYLAQSSTARGEIYGNGVFQNVMARLVEALVADDTERANLSRLLVDPTPETRLQGLELLAAYG